MAAPQSTPLPPAPQRNESESEFISKSNAFVAALPPFQVDLQAQADFVDQRVADQATLITDATNTAIAAVIDDVEAARDDAQSSAASASSSASTATIKASSSEVSSLNSQQAAQTALATGNYNGRWSTLSGAYSAGVSVEHSNVFWALRSNTSNIAAIEPGVSAEWIAINGANLGTAATKDAGIAAGDVMEVGAFGLGARIGLNNAITDFSNISTDAKTGIYYSRDTAVDKPPLIGGAHNIYIPNISTGFASMLSMSAEISPDLSFRSQSGGGWSTWARIITTHNTTVDGSGFIKEASPIVKLYSDKIEVNDYKEIEDCAFERVAAGHYIIKGAPLLSRDGWYIETLKDRNGNVYFTLDYEELDDGLHIKTYEPNYSSGRAENGAPVDIDEGRFVTLRFEEDEKERGVQQ